MDEEWYNFIAPILLDYAMTTAEQALLIQRLREKNVLSELYGRWRLYRDQTVARQLRREIEQMGYAPTKT